MDGLKGQIPDRERICAAAAERKIQVWVDTQYKHEFRGPEISALSPGDPSLQEQTLIKRKQSSNEEVCQGAERIYGCVKVRERSVTSAGLNVFPLNFKRYNSSKLSFVTLLYAA